MQSVWLHLPIVPVQGNHDTSPFGNMFHHFNCFHSKCSFYGTVTDHHCEPLAAKQSRILNISRLLRASPSQ